MRRSVWLVVVLLALTLAGAALAAKPAKKASYAGATTEKKNQGFRAIATFSTNQNASRLTNFNIQTLACFDVGSVPVAVDPFANQIWIAPNLPLTKRGAFKSTVTLRSGAWPGYKMIATISGTFVSPTHVRGKFAVSSVKTSGRVICQPYSVKFSAFSPPPDAAVLQDG